MAALPAWVAPVWQKIGEGLTDLPALIRLLNQRFTELYFWVKIMHARASNETDFNVLNWGWKGDDKTDCWPGWDAIHKAMPWQGAQVRVPFDSLGIFYFSKNMAWKKPVRFVATSPPNSNAFAFAAGTVLSFAPDYHGVSFESYITDEDPVTQLEITRPRDDAYPGANFSIIDGFLIKSRGGPTGLLNGGTGRPVDGLKFRVVGCSGYNTYVEDFSRENISIRGSIGGAASAIPEMEGSPNNWFLMNCTGTNAGRHNFYAHGADTNAGCSIRLSCAGAGQINLYDSSFLGNVHIMPHCNTSGLMDYKSDNPNAATVFIGPYTEGPDTRNVIMRPAIVIGGFLGVPECTTPGSTGVVLAGSGEMSRRALQHQNLSGATGIGISLGNYDPPNMILQAFGTLDAGGYGEFTWVYDIVSHFIQLRNSGQPARDLIGLPNNLLSLRQYAIALRNGFYIGTPTDLTFFGKAAAMPTTGSWVQGDYLANTAPAILGSAGSRYVVEGWKRITTGSGNVLNTDWTEDRGLTGT